MANKHVSNKVLIKVTLLRQRHCRGTVVVLYVKREVAVAKWKKTETYVRSFRTYSRQSVCHATLLCAL